MGLWVLEPKSGEKVPGTVYVEAVDETARVKTAHFKTGRGRHADIILVPQPSQSPNDPLNWPEWEKRFHSVFLATGSGISSGCAFFLNPSHGVMAKQMHTSLTQLSRSISFMMLALGFASIFTTPLARIYGKRPIFLLLGVLGIIGYAIILHKPGDIKYIYGGRVLWGFAVSGLQYLVSSSVGDIFFVHQRGFHLALWHFGLSAGNSLGQVIASQIVQRQNYVAAFRYALITMVIYMALLFLLIQESTYNRAKKYDTDIHEHLADESEVDLVGNSHSTTSIGNEKSVPKVANTSTSSADSTVDEENHSTVEKRKTFLQNLKVYNGRFSHENYLRAVLSPFVTLLLPAVHWGAYSYGLSVAFAAAFSVCLAQIFAAPPYNFKPAAIGLTVLSPFVAYIIGNFVPGPIADWLVKYMSRKNGGVYEPEFRNLLCIPALIIGGIGFWGFGLCIHYRVHWFAPVFCFGLTAFGGAITSLISNTYLLDCHRQYAQDAYAAVSFVKAVGTFAVSFIINDWLKKYGPINVFFVLGGIHIAGCLYGLFLYVYGKRIRLAVHKSTRLQKILQFAGNAKQ